MRLMDDDGERSMMLFTTEIREYLTQTYSINISYKSIYHIYIIYIYIYINKIIIHKSIIIIIII